MFYGGLVLAKHGGKGGVRIDENGDLQNVLYKIKNIFHLL
jgi:hypothetical protein